MHDFDQVIDRRGSYSIKFQAKERGKPEDALPLWVADMDFRAPDCVVEALRTQADHGIYGYSDTDEAYFETLRRWFQRRFDWNIEPDWLIKTPGVVTAIHIALNALTKPGDHVMIQQPVYYPFAAAVNLTGRSLVVNELIYEKGRYEIDFDAFEREIIENKVKLFILCSPHNPVGRVWTREELWKMGDLCHRHGVLVIADEIHQDFIYEGHRHLVFEALDQRFRDMTVTCTAPSKTFNLAGLQLSNLFIPNRDLRKAFVKEYARCGLSQAGLMGIAACKAAYEGGEDWLSELLTYLAGNIAYVRDFLLEHLPQVKLVEPEGTYLLWLDFQALGLSREALDDLILGKAKLWLNPGHIFGAGGEGFQRVNIACPRKTVEEAMTRLARAIHTQ